MRGKPKAAGSWLPNQVAYGMDCSDIDPANWKPFGYAADDQAAKAELQKHQPAAKGVPQGQSTP